MQEIEGDVIVKVIVSSSGDLSSIKVLKRLIREIVKAWLFKQLSGCDVKPAKRNGYFGKNCGNNASSVQAKIANVLKY